ncbi:MAG: hypothetical protein AAFX02_10115, partial [Pseudomonadota bacterium]
QTTLDQIRSGAIEAVRSELSEELKRIAEEKAEALDTYITNIAPEFRRLATTDREAILGELPARPANKQIETVVAGRWMARQAELKSKGAALLTNPPEVDTKE